MKSKDNKVLQFKVSLDNSKPLIWRRILISEDSSFFDLHLAIQDSMGWLDYHLHCFYLSQKGTANPIVIRLPNPEFDDDGMEIVLDERSEKIASHFNRSIKQCQYEYDFGDGWSHTVLFEREVPMEADKKYPQCIAGKNACPPEDSGGVWGYIDKLEILKNPKHSEHKDILEWLCIDGPSDFDPSTFDLDEIEFRDAKQTLREYEKGFGISDNALIQDRNLTDDAILKANLKLVSELKGKDFLRMGNWEVAQRTDPITEKMVGKDSAFILTLIAHEESYFILNTLVHPPGEDGNVIKALLDAIFEHSTFPDIVLTKDKKIYEELELIAKELNFEILLVKKLKASPQIFRDMTRMLG